MFAFKPSESAFVLLISLIDGGARWRQSVSLSDNKRNKDLHSPPLVRKAGFSLKKGIMTSTFEWNFAH